MSRRLLMVWLLLALLPVCAHAVDVKASLDRDSVRLGETVTLNLRINGAANQGGAPDLKPLAQDFDVLGSSQNSSFSFINGKASNELVFGIALRPRREGTLQIPPLEVAGGQSPALTLTVNPVDPAAVRAAQARVFMEAEVEPRQGYVGQQLSYVVRLFNAVTIVNGSLDPPQVDGAEISPLGDDVIYVTQRNGRSYQVRERRYALIPQRAGALRVGPAHFRGQGIDPSDPDSLFGATLPLSAASSGVELHVKPSPADWGKHVWLPARDLQLSLDGWPAADTPARVGQPINLTMNLQATGLPFDVLPALTLPPLDGATVYPDKPVTGNRLEQQWIVGRRHQAFAIVPERAGTLTLPATTLKWWNVQTDQLEEAQIPEHSVTVLPAVGGVAQSQPPATSAEGASLPPSPADHSASSEIPWRGLALGSLALWLLSALVWWWRRRTRRLPRVVAAVPDSVRACRRAFMAAAQGDDSREQLRLLLAWARAERPTITRAADLAAALGDARQRDAIAWLQQQHYAALPQAADPVPLANVFEPGFLWRVDASPQDNLDLPPLYPFTTQ